MLSRVRMLAPLAALAALTLAACGGGDPASTGASTSPSVAATTAAPTTAEPTATASATPLAAADGVDAAAYDKALAQFPKAPAATVVTTSVPLAEVLSALSIKVVGVPSSMTLKLPEALKNVPTVGNSMAPDVEKIVKLAPKLVVSAEASRSTIESSLADTKIPSAFLRTDNLADLKLAVKVLGTAFDKKAEADTAMAAILKQEALLTAQKDSGKSPKVLVLIGTPDSFMVVNNKGFVGSLLESAGADNIAVSQLKAKETYSAVDLEAVVAAAPDVVLVLQAGNTADAQKAFDKEVSKNPAWKSLPAFKNKRITMLDYQVFGSASLAGVEPAVTTLIPLLG